MIVSDLQSHSGSGHTTPARRDSEALDPRPLEIRRVAIIFDDKLRPETTGTYCRRALERMVEFEHVRPADLSRLQPLNASTAQRINAFDLYLRIDDGLDYHLPAGLHPTA